MRNKFKTPSPAMVVALLALFVALGGTGFAAGNAVFSSPSKAQIIKIVKQVAPKLSVKRAAGLTNLPSGHSESGLFTGGGSDNGWIGLSIIYPRPLAAPIADAKIIEVLDSSATHCAGPGYADPGYLCLYNWDENNTDFDAWYSNDGSIFPSRLGRFGVDLYWTTSGSAYVGGSWTVTAP